MPGSGEWLAPYRWPKGVSGNPRGRPPTNLEKAVKRLLEEQHETEGVTNVELLARRIVKAALSGKSLERNALLAREWPAIERHEVELIEPDYTELDAHLAALDAPGATNGVGTHPAANGKDGPA